MKLRIYGIRNCGTMKALALLEENSSAIKRPILEAGSKLLVGFDAAEYEAKL